MKMNKKLLGGSLILLVAFGLFNLLNFIFQATMSRLMTLAEYGTLAVLYNFLYVFGGFSETIQNVLTKYTSKISDEGKLKNIIKRAFNKSAKFSIVLFIVFSFLAFLFSKVWGISYGLMVLTGSFLFVAFYVPITRGILQGRQKFKSLGVNLFVEAVIKLSLAILLVYLGWSVFGAIVGTLVGMLAAFAFSFFQLAPILKSKEKKIEVNDIYQYTKPSVIIMFVILLVYTLDVWIAKIVFPAEVAGIYAIGAILSKIIFFGSQPVSKAMFPMSAEKKETSESESIFINSLVLVTLIAIVCLILFYFIPETIIKIFKGEVIKSSAQILFYLGIGTSLLSFANLILLYKLSLGKVKKYGYLLMALVFEAGLLFYFSNNLTEFSFAFTASSAIFLWVSVCLVGD